MVSSGDISLRPAFTILAYPVISFTDKLTSPKNQNKAKLIGQSDQRRTDQVVFSRAECRPQYSTSFFAASDDSTAVVGNSIAYYQALNRSKVPAEMTIYQKGGHGFATFNKDENDHWATRAVAWLGLNGF